MIAEQYHNAKNKSQEELLSAIQEAQNEDVLFNKNADVYRAVVLKQITLEEANRQLNKIETAKLSATAEFFQAFKDAAMRERAAIQAKDEQKTKSERQFMIDIIKKAQESGVINKREAEYTEMRVKRELSLEDAKLRQELNKSYVSFNSKELEDKLGMEGPTFKIDEVPALDPEDLANTVKELEGLARKIESDDAIRLASPDKNTSEPLTMKAAAPASPKLPDEGKDEFGLKETVHELEVEAKKIEFQDKWANNQDNQPKPESFNNDEGYKPKM